MRSLIQALKEDKKRHLEQIKGLQARIDQLAPENARLHESLGNAETNNMVSTTLLAVGGFLVSYATFTGRVAPTVANASAGCLLSGIFLMFAQSVLRRLRR